MPPIDVASAFRRGNGPARLVWDLAIEPDYALINKLRYKELLLRTVHQILGPLGLEEEDLLSLANDGCRQLAFWPHEESWEEEVDGIVDLHV